MRQFIKRYLNELVSLAVLVLMAVAFVDGQVQHDRTPGVNGPATTAIVAEQVR